MAPTPRYEDSEQSDSKELETVDAHANEGEALEEVHTSDEQPQEETQHGTRRDCCSMGPAMLEHMHGILGLLESKFAPDKDISQISRKLWNSHEGAVDISKNDSLGQQFLNSFAPCGKSLVKELPYHGQQGFAKSNLQLAYDILKKWVTEVPNSFNCYSAPWNDTFLVDPKDKKVIENKTSWSETSWLTLTLKDINGYSDKNGTNQSLYNVLFSNSFDDKFLIGPMEMLFGQDTWTVQKHYEWEDDHKPVSGIVSHFAVDRSLGIISFDEVAAILCLARGTEFSPSGEPEFLDGHVSPWRLRSTHERCGERSFHLDRSSKMHDNLATTIDYGVFMHYMRSFTKPEAPNDSESPRFSGLRCQRESIDIRGFYNSQLHQLTEKRYSACLSLLPFQPPNGQFVLVSITDGSRVASTHGSRHVWDNYPGSSYSFYDRGKPWDSFGILPAGLYSGISVFQLQICATIKAWEQDWISTIEFVDDLVSVQVNVLNDLRILKDLVLKPKSDSSVEYFKVLQMLGLFSNLIREAETYLETLIPHVRNPAMKSYPHRADTEAVLTFNWNVVRKQQKEASALILAKLERTKNEVNTLRDGLFNVQSITEAQKSLKLNQYLLVFTLVTIFYLPPSLVATFYGLDMFQSSATESFWKTVFGISIGTYVLSAFGLFGFHLQRDEKPSWLGRLSHFPSRLATDERRDKWRSWLKRLSHFPSRLATDERRNKRRSWLEGLSFWRAKKSSGGNETASEGHANAEATSHV